MTKTNFSTVILAAGKGTRMKSNVHKPLHEVGHRPMIVHVLKAFEAADAEQIVVVKAPDDQLVDNYIDNHPSVVQEEQLGTGHAAQTGMDGLKKGTKGKIVFALGDMPLIEPNTIHKIVEDDNVVTVLAMRPDDPKKYGRLIVNEDDHLEKIVEYKDANPAERRVRLCNSGTIAIDADYAAELLDEIKDNNASSEYYLPDVVAIANKKGLSCGVVVARATETAAANSRAELAELELIFQNRQRQYALENGVTLTSPETVFLSADTQLGQDVVIEPNVVIGPGVTLEDDVTIKSFTHLENVTVKKGATIGPFSRLRGHSEIGEQSEIGNFVEVNRSSLGQSVKAKHLAYMGDADIGDQTNIAAGTIFANYDGYFKHKTTVGKNVLTGSNSTIKAPVEIKDNAIIGAGTVITENVDADDLAIGRVRQENKSGWAKDYRAEKSKENLEKKSNG